MCRNVQYRAMMGRPLQAHQKSAHQDFMKVKKMEIFLGIIASATHISNKIALYAPIFGYFEE
jgi:hypothetical protein